jgi:hypothetical protein
MGIPESIFCFHCKICMQTSKLELGIVTVFLVSFQKLNSCMYSLQMIFPILNHN